MSAGRKRNIESCVDFDARFALELNVSILESVARGFLRHLHSRGRAVRRNPQPPQLGRQLPSGARAPLCLKAVQDQLVDLSASGFIFDAARLGDEQFLIAVEPHRYVIEITLAVLEPASQPLVNGLPARTGCTVGTRSDKEFDAVPSSIEPVPAPGLLVHHSGPGWREIVLFGRLNQPRRRSG